MLTLGKLKKRVAVDGSTIGDDTDPVDHEALLDFQEEARTMIDAALREAGGRIDDVSADFEPNIRAAVVSYVNAQVLKALGGYNDQATNEMEQWNTALEVFRNRPDVVQDSTGAEPEAYHTSGPRPGREWVGNQTDW